MVGDIKDAQEVLTGVDLVTGEQLSTTERLVTAIAAILPVIPGKVLRKGLGAAADVSRKADEAVEGTSDLAKSSRRTAGASGSFGGLTGTSPGESRFLNEAAASFGEESVFRSAKRFRENIIIQRSDIEWSVENTRRMASGNAPFVRNAAGEWEKLNLHHVGRQDGRLIEVAGSHNTYNPSTGGPLHIPGPGSPARDARLVADYWVERLRDAVKNGSVSSDVLREAGIR